MNLEKTYIKINKSTVEYTLKFIYKEGYGWTAENYTINYAMSFFELHNYNYVVLFKNKFFTFGNEINFDIKSYKQFNINKYLREEKLKRILK